ncbi:hypothetical protein [Actinoplanes sp. NPDC051494]|uniref:hypothetical protein n=1 Tax=Actinoplanes sp. NPDC051494 TaxID=3363907 RepID=UPI00379FA636
MRLRHRAAVITAVAGIALTGVAVAGPAMAATSAPVKAAASAPTRAFSAEGTVSGVSVPKGTVTVAGASGSSTTVAVAPNAVVSVDGDTAKLAKLPVGARVKLSGNVTDGVSVASRVDATSTWPFATIGSVAAVNASASTVTVKRISLSSSTATTTDVIPVAAKAAISLDGRTVALSALPTRAHLLVTGTVTNGTYAARSLTAVSRWDLSLSGTVSAVDAAAGTVTVTTGSPATAVKLNVDPKATIKVNGAKVSLSNLPIGATVGLTGTETTVGTSISGIDAKVASSKTK